MPLQNQKQLFDIPNTVTYLNIASLSPSFKAVEEAGIRAIKEKSKPYLIPSSDFFNPVITVKKLFAKLIDVPDYNRVVTIPSVSYGMATVANNITLKENDEVLVIEEQFPSNIYVWKRLVKKYNAKLKVIRQPNLGENSGKQWNSDIINAITEHTALVAMGNIHWANGTLFDLKTIREKTKKNNALLIIDGSQSIGALPFSVKSIDPDALICAGYKWLFGPYGSGYAYYGSYFDNGIPLEENWSARLGSENLSGLTLYENAYKPLANRYSVGESGNFIYIQMQIEALKQVIKWTPVAIQDYCKVISLEAVEALKNMGCLIENESQRSHHLFGVKLPKTLDKLQLKAQLNKQNIYVSFRGDYIRLSSHLYNTREDFQKLTQCIYQNI